MNYHGLTPYRRFSSGALKKSAVAFDPTRLHWFKKINKKHYPNVTQKSIRGRMREGYSNSRVFLL